MDWLREPDVAQASRSIQKSPFLSDRSGEKLHSRLVQPDRGIHSQVVPVGLKRRSKQYGLRSLREMK